MKSSISGSRLGGLPRGNVKIEVLEAYRNANSHVYDLIRVVEDRGLERQLAGYPDVETDSIEQFRTLCARTARALQVIGDQLLEASSALNPNVAPEDAGQQAQLLYTEVQYWVQLAHQAELDPDFDLPTDLPAQLDLGIPARCSEAYVNGLIAGAKSLRVHTEAALLDFQKTASSYYDPTIGRKLQARMTSATSSAGYAERLYLPGSPSEVRQQALGYVVHALQDYFALEQMIAMPRLTRKSVPVVTSQRLPARPKPKALVPQITPTYPAVIPRTAASALTPLGYAGFFNRLVAAGIDWFICLFAGSILAEILGMGSAPLLVVIAFAWVYFAGFESSRRGATPGKMIYGYRVTDEQGVELSFRQASGRYFAMYVTMITMLLGLLTILVTARRQALHDILSRTVVVRY